MINILCLDKKMIFETMKNQKDGKISSLGEDDTTSKTFLHGRKLSQGSSMTRLDEAGEIMTTKSYMGRREKNINPICSEA